MFVGDGVYPPGGGRGHHLATVPPGVGGNRRPWGGNGHGGGKVFLSVLFFTKDGPRLSVEGFVLLLAIGSQQLAVGAKPMLINR